MKIKMLDFFPKSNTNVATTNARMATLNTRIQTKQLIRKNKMFSFENTL